MLRIPLRLGGLLWPGVPVHLGSRPGARPAGADLVVGCGCEGAWRHLRVLVLSLPPENRRGARRPYGGGLLMLAYDLNEAELVVSGAAYPDSGGGHVAGAGPAEAAAGGRKPGQGDFSHPITLSRGALPELKRHAANLNSVQQGIQQAVEEKMKSERLKTQLITNVSHDIKNAPDLHRQLCGPAEKRRRCPPTAQGNTWRCWTGSPSGCGS